MFIPQVGALSYGNPKWGVRRPAIARRGLNMIAASVGNRRVHSMGTRRGAGATYSQSRLGSRDHNHRHIKHLLEWRI